MTFEEILDQAIAMLQRRGRVTYQTLRLQFQLDEERFEALKDAILFAYPQVVDAAGRGLVWSGEAGAIPPPTPASPQSVEPPVTLAPRVGTAVSPPNRNPLKPNVANSLYCFVTWWIRRCWPVSSIRKSCVRWCAPIKRSALR